MIPTPIPVEGPVELIDGKLVLRIPFEMGGMGAAATWLGIGKADGGRLNVEIQPWLAQKLGIAAGSRVVVSIDMVHGNFSITPSAGEDQLPVRRATAWALASGRTPALRWLATLNVLAALAVVAPLALAGRGDLTVYLPTVAVLFGLSAAAHWWRWSFRWLLQGLAIAVLGALGVLLRA